MTSSLVSVLDDVTSLIYPFLSSFFFLWLKRPFKRYQRSAASLQSKQQTLRLLGSSALNNTHPEHIFSDRNKLKMSSGAGIQELMAAETRASQIVAEARIGESEF